jgi:myo-inositol 2-dehydrogenase / D-chiro-inositol 1-dehydrogenase
VKFCQIGCGRHALGYHGPSQAKYAASTPAFERAACCDPDAERAGAYRERFGFARAYTDLEAMLDREGPDAVALAVPPERSCELGCAVLGRGVPALLEKPPGLVAAEVDRLIAAAGRPGGAAVPHLVAFNRRFVPLVRELDRRLRELGGPEAIDHVRYEMTRHGRDDPDFSTTAIHGVDLVRFLARADYDEVGFRYRAHPSRGPGVADLLLDARLASGATASLGFFPQGGAVLERVTVHAEGHTFLLRIPMWNGFDAPGRLEHLDAGALVESAAGGDAAEFELGGFYGEYLAFFEALEAGRPPEPGLFATRQSVEVAEAMRGRAGAYRRGGAARGPVRA